jgi:hypothetical protein
MDDHSHQFKARRPEPSYEELRVQLEETKTKLQRLRAGQPEIGPDIAEEEETVLKTCSHIRENGAFCQSAALGVCRE